MADARVRVSVLMPVRNRACRVGRAIASVLGQSWADLELLVVDDGSTDDLAGALAPWRRDRRLRALRHDAPRGAQAARNTALAAAEGQWIALLDSDDEWLATRVADHMEQAAAGVDLIHSRYLRLDEATGRALVEGGGPTGDAARDLLVGPSVGAPLTTTCPIDLVREVGGFDPSIEAFQEWDLQLSIVSRGRGRTAFLPDVHAVYHRHAGETISDDHARAGRGYLQVVRKHRAAIEAGAGRPALAEHLAVAASLLLRGGQAAAARPLLAEAVGLDPSRRRLRLAASWPSLLTAPTDLRRWVADRGRRLLAPAP